MKGDNERKMSVSESSICTGQKWTVVLSKPWICSKKIKESKSGEKKEDLKYGFCKNYLGTNEPLTS